MLIEKFPIYLCALLFFFYGQIHTFVPIAYTTAQWYTHTRVIHSFAASSLHRCNSVPLYIRLSIEYVCAHFIAPLPKNFILKARIQWKKNVKIGRCTCWWCCCTGIRWNYASLCDQQYIISCVFYPVCVRVRVHNIAQIYYIYIHMIGHVVSAVRIKFDKKKRREITNDLNDFHLQQDTIFIQPCAFLHVLRQFILHGKLLERHIQYIAHSLVGFCIFFFFRFF